MSIATSTRGESIPKKAGRSRCVDHWMFDIRLPGRVAVHGGTRPPNALLGERGSHRPKRARSTCSALTSPRGRDQRSVNRWTPNTHLRSLNPMNFAELQALYNQPFFDLLQ